MSALNHTQRDAVELALKGTFGGKLTSLDEPNSVDTINAHKDGTFGRSYLGYQLYANGHNAHSQSSHYQRGMMYEQDGNVFGVGVFFRPEEPTVPCIHIIAPAGPNWVQAVEDFCTKAEAAVPEARIFMRQLNYEQYKALGATPNLNRIIASDPELSGAFPMVKVNGAWTAIEADPWIKQNPGMEDGVGAPQEDETFNRSIINLGEMLTSPGQGYFANTRDGSSNSRSMARRNCNGFNNFMERHGLEYVLEPYDRSKMAEAKELVDGHFDMLHAKNSDVGSTKFDYTNLYTTFPEDHPGAGLHMYIGYVRKKDDHSQKVPVSFFGTEEILSTPDKKMVGMYATITSYDPRKMLGLVDGLTPDLLAQESKADELAELIKGHRNIAALATGAVLYDLKTNHGVTHAAMGGSEERKLNTGKEKYGAQEDETFWARRMKKGEKSWDGTTWPGGEGNSGPSNVR